MLVKDCMTRHPAMIPPSTPVVEAEQVMAENKVRHLPVVGDGKKLIGLITRQRLTLRPDTLASLNVWEITRYISGLAVEDVMLPLGEVITIEPTRTVERAAVYMSKHKVGCLPVIEDGIVIGILSEIDLLRSFQEMLGFRFDGVRATIRMPDREGEFAKLTRAVADAKMGIIGIGSFPAPRRPGYFDVVLKLPRVSIPEVEAVITAIPDQEIIDIRQVA